MDIVLKICLYTVVALVCVFLLVEVIGHVILDRIRDAQCKLMKRWKYEIVSIDFVLGIKRHPLHNSAPYCVKFTGTDLYLHGDGVTCTPDAKTAAMFEDVEAAVDACRRHASQPE